MVHTAYFQRFILKQVPLESSFCRKKMVASHWGHPVIGVDDWVDENPPDMVGGMDEWNSIEFQYPMIP